MLAAEPGFGHLWQFLQATTKRVGRDLSPAVHIADQTESLAQRTVASPALRLSPSLSIPAMLGRSQGTPARRPKAPPTINDRTRSAGGQSVANRIQPLPAKGVAS